MVNSSQGHYRVWVGEFHQLVSDEMMMRNHIFTAFGNGQEHNHERMFGLMTLIDKDATFSWGKVVWSTLTSNTFQYEVDQSSMQWRIIWGQLHNTSQQGVGTYDPKLDKYWEFISGLTLWFIWCDKCKQVFEGVLIPPTETVKNI
jgi:hypothetical protein